MVVTSYDRNKNRDDEIKKTKRRSIIASAIASRLLKNLPEYKPESNYDSVNSQCGHKYCQRGGKTFKEFEISASLKNCKRKKTSQQKHRSHEQQKLAVHMKKKRASKPLRAK